MNKNNDDNANNNTWIQSKPRYHSLIGSYEDKLVVGNFLPSFKLQNWKKLSLKIYFSRIFPIRIGQNIY